MKVQVPQSCLTICDPMDCSLPGSSIHGILQERVLEWVVTPFSAGAKIFKEIIKSHPSLFLQLLNLVNDPMERSFLVTLGY